MVERNAAYHLLLACSTCGLDYVIQYLLPRFFLIYFLFKFFNLLNFINKFILKIIILKIIYLFIYLFRINFNVAWMDGNLSHKRFSISGYDPTERHSFNGEKI